MPGDRRSSGLSNQRTDPGAIRVEVVRDNPVADTKNMGACSRLGEMRHTGLLDMLLDVGARARVDEHGSVVLCEPDRHQPRASDRSHAR